MKDLAHHLKKLNRKILRSIHRLESEDLNYEDGLPAMPSPTKRPKRQLRKQAKQKMKRETNAREPTQLSKEDRNDQMKHRTPVFDRWNHPRRKVGARPSKKKMPRI